MILAPADASPSAIASPSPFDPPVIMADFPVKSNCLIPGNISGDYSCKKVRILNLFPYYFIELTYRNDSRIFSSSTASRSSSESCETVGRVDLNRFAKSEEHTSELQSRENLVCRLLLE